MGKPSHNRESAAATLWFPVCRLPGQPAAPAFPGRPGKQSKGPGPPTSQVHRVVTGPPSWGSRPACFPSPHALLRASLVEDLADLSPLTDVTPAPSSCHHPGLTAACPDSHDWAAVRGRPGLGSEGPCWESCRWRSQPQAWAPAHQRGTSPTQKQRPRLA